MRFQRIALIVLDSVGIGEMPDAASFGDVGSHTLGHIIRETPGLQMPRLRRWGIDRIAELPGWQASDEAPAAFYGKMSEASVGKDTMTGHWEIAGLRVTVPFQTFPNGFPDELIQAFEQRTGRKVLGNKPSSGTVILDELGEEQMNTGAWIVYTSADSVFQIAAHEEVIPLDELYRACEVARELTMDERFAVGRVIARPYIGKPGAFARTPNRHDYALKPPAPTVLNALQRDGFDVIAVGKIHDIFDGEGITQSFPTKSNDDGIRRTLDLLETSFEGLLFTNLVDFDSLYGHRRDPIGYGLALEAFDRAVPELEKRLGPSDLLIITADHGNDPVHGGTDHTREYVPLLLYSPAFVTPGDVGIRATFADIAATIADNFGVTPPPNGESLLDLLG
ncbi:phosphopentomutase [Paenibacillus sp. MMS18-CY102]|uniref:phosphopentomutase n=1 Tax=Paenibacillus sp. MMS18-CY102 TaxID=2682849 RepID=UPI00136583C2|nr:phosphopentomutase [Paenibacillus sp. MMS18-CY102]MWC28397.1 phosphopentomutase [Paenibacillus sp. MMS18-CY102]